MNKFKQGDELMHKKGGKYLVVELPDEDDLLEACGLPFYTYVSFETGKVWRRRFDEIEQDDRFKKIGEHDIDTLNIEHDLRECPKLFGRAIRLNMIAPCIPEREVSFPEAKPFPQYGTRVQPPRNQ